ncbi:hypothetical protein GCM10009416_41230 [Craurococcus roseus]|uniref:Glycoside hydrolase family 5 domain-containing protein n=1 Tax=Craurococcus roseus TaxID=77585 RepID=A0ABP3QWQ6_9PROT
MRGPLLAVLLLLFTNAARALVTLPDSSASIGTSKSVVATSDCEAVVGDLCFGWSVNAWGGATHQAGTSSSAIHGTNKASQWFSVTSKGSGDAHLYHPFTFAYGVTYQATLWMRAEAPATVQVTIRRDGGLYDDVAAKTVTLSGEWQPVSVKGIYPLRDGEGSVRVNTSTLGVKIHIGKFELETLSGNPLQAHLPGRAVNANFSGMLVNKLGVHSNWPPIATKVLRLWDTVTDWRSIETARDVWDFHRLDYYLSYAEANGAKVLLTLGQTPSWAAADPDASCVYDAGCSPPASNQDWRNYVRKVAQRYGRRIAFYEIWNEPDYKKFWRGTPEHMVELTRIAKEEIIAANPQAIIVSPSVTPTAGVSFLDRFLFLGGGQYIDALGYHNYYSITPETQLSFVQRLRFMTENYPGKSYQFWNTEGAPDCDHRSQDCKAFEPTDDDKLSSVTRALLIMAAQGVDHYSFYAWDINDLTFAPLSDASYRSLTTTGEAYNRVLGWLSNAVVRDAFGYQGVYVVRFSTGTAVWSDKDDVLAQIPAAWRHSNYKDVTGALRAIPANKRIRLTRKPVWLR